MNSPQPIAKAAIGAAVRFFPAAAGDADLKPHQVGEIVHLWSDTCVNIQFNLPDDRIVIRSSVPLFQEGIHHGAHGCTGYYAELIPPQASTEATSTTAEAKPQPKVITPTIGRRVWYWPSDYDCGLGISKPETIIVADDSSGQPCDAGVVRVFNDRLVNLSVTDHEGNVHKRTSVTLYQPGDNISHVGGGYCTWMDYQVKQAQGEPVTATLGSFDPSTARLASPILRYFKSAHLPSHLQEIAECVEMCAQFFDDVLPNGPEKSTALRKLLEAKDCAVRAALDLKPEPAINVELRPTCKAVDLRDIVAGMTLSPNATQHTENPDHVLDEDEAIGDRSDGVGEGPAGESDADLPDGHPV
jgi:hypothetical protein